MQPSPNRLLTVRLAGLLRFYLTLAFPVLLVLGSVRLVMTPLFLQLVYNRPGFPQDIYGFTTPDRLEYAPLALEYLLSGHDITFLGDLRFPDGSHLYNARELRHMADVKHVTDLAFTTAIIGGLAALTAGFALFRTPYMRGRLRLALMQGSLLTLSLIAAIVIVVLVNWDFFFTAFHELFFASGTWRFEYSDTLIRLFPEQFWFEAALTIGGLTAFASGAVLVVMWRWQPK